MRIPKEGNTARARLSEGGTSRAVSGYLGTGQAPILETYKF